MPPSKVKPIIGERNNIELQFREEANPYNDLLQCLGILCDDTITVAGGSLDPSVSPGLKAEVGSLYASSNGNLYKKTGTSDTDWAIFTAPSFVYYKTASTDINGHRVLAVDDDGKVLHADNTILWHRHNILGISKQAVSAGNQVEIAIEGDELTETSWNWDTQLPIYLSTDGLLTQTIPSNGFIVIVAETITSTTIRIKINNSIILA